MSQDFHHLTRKVVFFINVKTKKKIIILHVYFRIKCAIWKSKMILRNRRYPIRQKKMALHGNFVSMGFWPIWHGTPRTEYPVYRSRKSDGICFLKNSSSVVQLHSKVASSLYVRAPPRRALLGSRPFGANECAYKINTIPSGSWRCAYTT